jgi:predicted DNA binding protein
VARSKASSRARDAPSPQALAGLRRRTARGDEPFAVYRLAFELPKDAPGGAISRAHPELRFEIANRLDLAPDRLLYEIRVIGPNPAGVRAEALRFREMISVEVQAEGTEVAVYRIVQRTPVLLQLTQQHRILARYPLTFQDGWARFETIAKASQVRRFLKETARRVGSSHVEAVRRGPVLAQNLGMTGPQESLFRAALSAGYFNSPRGISISQLAERLGRSKSSTSEMLSKIQRRLAETAVQVDLGSFFGGSG